MSIRDHTVFPEHEPDPYRAAYLIAGYINNELTEDEHDELDAWVEKSDDNMRLFGELTDERNIQESLQALRRIKPEVEYEALRQRIREEKSPRTMNFRTALAVAASLFLMVAAYIIYRWQDNKPEDEAASVIAVNDIPPGGNHATLTIAGNITDLGKAPDGLLWRTADSTRLEKDGDGLIKYTAGGYPVTNETTHTLTTPKGGQYSIMLEDGTRVWLNAASSLSYPAVFTGEERLVRLTGEGYFEVASSGNNNHKKPFIVQVGDMEVRVTGTKFNINAYDDEPSVNSTLLEGSVTVSSPNGGQLTLTPGQQAQYANNKLGLKKTVSAEEVTAWKNAIFKFRDSDLKSIMRQVSRWYNATVIYKGNIDGHFNATIDRNVPVSRLLHYLQLTGHVSFEIKGDTILVEPQEQ